jgi:hypothetical protein
VGFLFDVNYHYFVSFIGSQGFASVRLLMPSNVPGLSEQLAAVLASQGVGILADMFPDLLAELLQHIRQFKRVAFLPLSIQLLLPLLGLLDHLRSLVGLLVDTELGIVLLYLLRRFTLGLPSQFLGR